MHTKPQKLLVEVQLMEVVVPIVAIEPGDYLQILNGVCVGKAARSMLAAADAEAAVKANSSNGEQIPRRLTGPEADADLTTTYKKILEFCRTPRNKSEIARQLNIIDYRATVYTAYLRKHGHLKLAGHSYSTTRKPFDPLLHHAPINAPRGARQAQIKRLLQGGKSATATAIATTLGTSPQVIYFHAYRMEKEGDLVGTSLEENGKLVKAWKLPAGDNHPSHP